MKSVTTSRTLPVRFLSRNRLDLYVKILVWLFLVSKDTSRELNKVARRMAHIWDKNGAFYLIRYLKECVRLVQYFVAQSTASPSEEIRVAVYKGLPLLITRPLRLRMEAGDWLLIKIVLSLLSAYRIIRAPLKLKLETITGPFTGVYKSLPVFEMSRVWDTKFRGLVPSKLKFSRMMISVSAGPNCRVAHWGLPLDAYAWTKRLDLVDAFKTYADETGNSFIWNMFWKEINWVLDRVRLDKKVGIDHSADLDPTHLGSLSIKEEAAGKARVFAISDGWTQSLFSGLHDTIFEVLKKIPQDGTFDQSAPVNLLKADLAASEDQRVYSYDLTAATDRLPIDLQVDILTRIVGRKAALSWKKILVDRDWYLSQSGGTIPLRYEVGQPMGAYSSWGMLSLTHHFLVQLSASRVGYKGWFVRYALLGDDIVIADEAVAKVYLQIMTDLGVDINLFKSLHSKVGVFEFAKRLVSPKQEFTPVGAANALWATYSFKMIPSLFLDRVGKGEELTCQQVREIFSHKFPVRSSRIGSIAWNRVLWLILGPFGFIMDPVHLTSSMKIAGLSTVRLNSMIHSIDQAHYELELWMHQSSREFLERTWKSLWSDSSVHFLALTDLDLPPSKEYYNKRLWDIFFELMFNTPVRRYIFDAPLGFNFYVPGAMRRIVDYVTKKVSGDLPATNYLIASGWEPAVPKLPTLSKRGSTFFERVCALEHEKDKLRGGPFTGY